MMIIKIKIIIKSLKLKKIIKMKITNKMLQNRNNFRLKMMKYKLYKMIIILSNKIILIILYNKHKINMNKTYKIQILLKNLEMHNILEILVI